jgi:hypothetical protein
MHNGWMHLIAHSPTRNTTATETDAKSDQHQRKPLTEHAAGRLDSELGSQAGHRIDILSSVEARIKANIEQIRNCPKGYKVVVKRVKWCMGGQKKIKNFRKISKFYLYYKRKFFSDLYIDLI